MPRIGNKGPFVAAVLAAALGAGASVGLAACGEDRGDVQVETGGSGTTGTGTAGGSGTTGGSNTGTTGQ